MNIVVEYLVCSLDSVQEKRGRADFQYNQYRFNTSIIRYLRNAKFSFLVENNSVKCFAVLNVSLNIKKELQGPAFKK